MKAPRSSVGGPKDVRIKSRKRGAELVCAWAIDWVQIPLFANT
jgi:hypothetical protein